MRVLVTGASGFVGFHLLGELQEHGHQPVILAMAPAHLLPAFPGAVADLRQPEALRAALDQLQPDACIHLAAQAHVPTSWQKPAETMEINVTGSIHLLEAFRSFNPAARILLISTAEVYGRYPAHHLVGEDATFQPGSIYGISKAAADMTARAYAQKYGMATLVARPQNHIGPGQAPIFAASSFAIQIAALSKNPALPRQILVGNLESERDFTDVRDVVRAYRMILEKGTAGLAYNIASGHNRPISTLLDCLCNVAGIYPHRILHDPYFRPTDIPAILDTRRIRNELGWQPVISFEDSVRDLYEAALASA